MLTPRQHRQALCRFEGPVAYPVRLHWGPVGSTIAPLDRLGSLAEPDELLQNGDLRMDRSEMLDA
jgi:hypothetical protein